MVRNACAAGPDGLAVRATVSLAALAILLLAAAPSLSTAQTLPPAFRDKTVFSGLTQPTAVAFASDGRVFVAEKSGLIKVFTDLSDTTPTVFADLRTQTYNFWDRGMLGLALHPNFPATPYVYVLYAYDAAIGGTAPLWGPGADGTNDPCPSPPGATGDGCVVSGRLSRLQASGDVMTGPEQVLIEDWFQQYPSHSIGSLVFGSDGALYASGGEGASFNFADYGQDGNPVNPGGDPPVPIGGIQTPPTAEGGALRSQDLRTTTGVDSVTLAGTVIRIDPDTGAGLPGNPLFGDPDANAKRIVAYGLRNPFRMTLRPGTSEFWVGDVGWGTWEEINRIQTTSSLTNFGWPCYEGNGKQNSYDNLNLNICENLYGESGAHTTPFYTYNHSAKIVTGETCPTGSSSISGVAFYTGSLYPSTYQGALFFSDYSRRCIWAMLPGAGGDPNPADRQTFVASAGNPVQLTTGPGGDLFYVDINDGKIHRIQYFVPVAVISADPTIGPAPLEVSFSGAGSTHPDPTETLSYSWDLDGDAVFGDATTVETNYTFTGVGSHTVALRVSDTNGGVDTESVVIDVDNAPPVPAIDTPLPTLTWKVGDVITFSGSATDPQDGTLLAPALSWSVLLHHCPSNCHVHPLQSFNGTFGSSIPAPDHEYPSHLELKLTATDSLGLQASTSILLYPQAVTLDFATSPTGLQLSHNATSGPAPFSSSVIIGSQNSVSAPSPQVLGGNSFEFQSWSDGGAASHNLTAPAAPATYTATFVLQPPPSALSATPSSVEGGTGSTGTVTLSGPAPASGADVALSSSNSPVASVPPSVQVAPGATSADFPITTTAVGSDTTVTLTAFYGAGNAQGTMTVTLPPNAPPSAAITNPSGGATFTAPASILIEASASDTDGTITRVDFYSGAILLGSATSTPYAYTWTNVPGGSYSLTAIATDDREGTATSVPVGVTVDAPNAPPSVAITSPSGGATFTAPASILIEASASDTDGTITRVDFYSGANLLGSATSTPYAYTWSNVPAGSYSLTAVATDDDQATTTSGPAGITVNAPNVPPSVAITNPVSGAVLTAPASLNIDASASDTDGTVTRVDFYQGSTLLGTDASAPYSFAWSNVGAGSYSLSAVATDNSGATTTSSAVSITVNNPSGLPAPWVEQDIGAVGVPGSATYSNGVYTVLGSGADIWGASDQFHFVYQPLSGDGEIVARVVSVQNTHSYAKSGVMIRQDLTANSPYAMTELRPNNSSVFQWRLTPGGATAGVASSGAAPHWVRLVRAGNSFTAYRSVNGINWIQVGSTTTVNLTSNVYVGLADSSHNNSTTCTTVFDNVMLAFGQPNSPPTAAITSPANGAILQDPTSVAIEAQAADTDGSVAQVAFYDGSVLLATLTAPPYTHTWSNPSSGAHSLTVRATDNAGAVTTSSAVSVTVNYTPTSLPAPWQQQDIGAVGLPGDATYSNGTYTVAGSGADIWGTSDQFHFVYQTLSGDGEIVARVVSLQNTHSYAKSGVMIRQDLTANSPYAMAELRPNNSSVFQWRLTPGGATAGVASSGAAPHWVRLVRAGNNFTAYRSANGTSWIQLGTTTTVNLTTNVYVGLAVSSHNNATTGTTVFDNVTKIGN